MRNHIHIPQTNSKNKYDNKLYSNSKTLSDIKGLFQCLYHFTGPLQQYTTVFVKSLIIAITVNDICRLQYLTVI